MFTLDPAGWTNFFFKLLNLCALFALFFYIFKQYILDGVRGNIIKEKQAEEAAQTKVLILEQKGKELVHATFTQEQYTRYLLEKADQWRQRSEFEHEKSQHELQLLRAATLTRTEQQAKTIETERLLKIVIPQAVTEARDTLQTMYEDQKKGAAYLQNLIVFMKKSL